jgi:hypothetical protein
MAISNHTELSAAIASWLKRSDLTANIPDFIALAEAEFNRVIFTVDTEKRATATLTGDSVALPADFRALRSISISGKILQIAGAGETFDEEATGSPKTYIVTDGQFFFRPKPTSGTVVINYHQSIPALTVGAPSNWLLTRHPDLYLFATLMQAEFYGWNDERLPLIKSKVEEIFGQIMRATEKERYGGARIVLRHSVMNVGRA